MKVTPRSEKEIQEMNLLPPGDYDFEVISASEEVSKKGNEMLVVKLRIFTDSGNKIITDYLTDSVAYKVRHFAEAVGLLDSYETGYLNPDDLTARSGRCAINVQVDKHGQYPDKNGIKDYVTQESEAAPLPLAGAALSAPVKLEDDDIPF